jgi:hypothetical protein
MFGRRRPLVRAAVLGGAAYHVGKRNAQKQQAQQEQANQEDQQAANEQEQASTGSKGGESNANFDELTKLQHLHDNGVLTDQEFADAKQKVIAKM